MNIIKFTDVEIFEINGSSKIKFEGSYTPMKLVKKLVDQWIPYYECHKCGKGDYCKFTIPHSTNNFKKRDIQCGVAKKALENYILKTIHVLNNSNKQKQQDYLDSAFYFYKYIYLSEQLNGLFIDNNILDYWGEASTHFLTDMLSIRDILNEFGKKFKAFPEVYKGQSLLLVEGETELIFIEYLQGDGNVSRTFNFIVDSYNGKGNKIPKRIQMLIEDYKSKGYSIYFQGDEDGNGDGTGYDKFKFYVDNRSIPKENIFQFKYDFETAFPRKMLLYVLQELGFLKDCSINDFNKYSPNKSINTILKEEYGIETDKNKLKTKIAKKLGNIIFHLDRNDLEELKEYEFYRFIKFIDSI